MGRIQVKVGKLKASVGKIVKGKKKEDRNHALQEGCRNTIQPNEPPALRRKTRGRIRWAEGDVTQKGCGTNSREKVLEGLKRKRRITDRVGVRVITGRTYFLIKAGRENRRKMGRGRGASLRGEGKVFPRKRKRPLKGKRITPPKDGLGSAAVIDIRNCPQKKGGRELTDRGGQARDGGTNKVVPLQKKGGGVNKGLSDPPHTVGLGKERKRNGEEASSNKFP